MLTFDEAYIQRVARQFCINLGMNPDETVSHGAEPDENGSVPMICMRSPRWTLYINIVKSEIALRKAYEVVAP